MIAKLIRLLFGSLRFFMMLLTTLIFVFLIPKNDISWGIFATPVIAWSLMEMQRKTKI